jgi:DNA polymerase I-like protein with 3'-5' exonuclease and polymerase domains
VAAGAELPRAKTGAPSVAVDALSPLRTTPGPVGDIVSAVLDYRHHDTIITTFLEPYQALVEHGDGRVRPTIYTLGTDTGRMACVRSSGTRSSRTRYVSLTSTRR